MARWEITNDEQISDLDRGGRFEEFREISFEVLDNGRRGRIKVPLRLYTPEYVAEQIQRYADNITAVGSQSSG